MKKIVFISDFFVNQIAGGGEICDNVLMSLFRDDGYRIAKFTSHLTSDNHIKLYRKCGYKFIVSNFCNLHEIEIQGIADGEVAKGIKPYNPITSGQLTREEIDECSKNPEKRISITPETSKNFKNLGLKVFLEKGFGESLGFSDKDYTDNGVEILSNASDVLSKSDLICKVNFPEPKDLGQIKENSHLIVSNYNPEKEKQFLKNKLNIFALNLLPRITRAQSMDVLSSQANLAGYRAVIESIYEYQKAVPMMMTAAGTVPAAKVLVVGAGVAGLQAIATAKRLGAIVSATDVRLTAKGLSVISLHRAISFASFSGVPCVRPVIVPRPPAFDTAAASSANPT